MATSSTSTPNNPYDTSLVELLRAGQLDTSPHYPGMAQQAVQQAMEVQRYCTQLGQRPLNDYVDVPPMQSNQLANYLCKAAEYAAQCDVLITIEIEPKGIAVIGRNGGDYTERLVPWSQVMGAFSSVISAVERVQLEMLGGINCPASRNGQSK